MDDLPIESAGFGIRLAARLIDYALVYLVAGIALGVLSVLTEAINPRAVKGVTHEGTIQFGVVVAMTLYHTLSESAGGASLGKRLVGLEVVSEELRPATVRQTWKRSLGFLIDSFFFGLVGYNAMKKSPERQRLGDEYGETRVVRRRSLPDALRRPTRIFFFVFLGAAALGAEAVILVQLLGYWLFA